jgi:hypothetical protein
LEPFFSSTDMGMKRFGRREEATTMPSFLSQCAACLGTAARRTGVDRFSLETKTPNNTRIALPEFAFVIAAQKITVLTPQVANELDFALSSPTCGDPGGVANGEQLQVIQRGCRH